MSLPAGIIALCQDSAASVSTVLATESSTSPGEAAARLFGNGGKATAEAADGAATATKQADNDSALEIARSCGSWGETRPSDLFLNAYHDALCTLDKDPLAGLVSPCLMGSRGAIPLTVIAPLLDIAKHMSNIIVRAQKEVILVTCSWSPSKATQLIADALRELSSRAGSRNERVVVKVMYDKAGPANFINAHQPVSPETYSGKGIQLPSPDQVPNLDMQVTSLHKPLLGTLHAKFMVVDREIGLVQSNNMESNPNMEMMTHLEGPIVDGLYDYALITWHNALSPPLPTHNTPASEGGYNSFKQESFQRLFVKKDGQSQSSEKAAEGKDGDDSARAQQQIVDDGAAATHLPAHKPNDPQWDDDLASEITRMQSLYSPKDGETRVQAINRELNRCADNNVSPAAAAPEPTAGDEFTPYIASTESLHFPIALVSRRPHGPPSNSDLHVPQNAAWLACIAHARRSIFIQTPDLNASPLLDALAGALKRGIQVTYYVCLGYNDPGEMMPGQGGTNEMFATKLSEALTPSERANLHVHWYVAKDQTQPISHKFKARACHIKLLIADDCVGIQGSGNMDTQSWFHSQEVNIMIDSPEMCARWREGIERNQNTARFGRGSEKDGIWRDQNGKEAEGTTGKVGPPMSWVKGFVGMAQKAKDKGGFG